MQIFVVNFYCFVLFFFLFFGRCCLMLLFFNAVVGKDSKCAERVNMLFSSSLT